MVLSLLSLLLSDAIGATLPDNLIISSKARPHYVIVVEKATQRLFVYQFNGDYHLVASFPCATGENGGDKQTRGDRRTPEGIYFFTKACDSRFLSPIYGARAFPMNYPNLVDERRNKGGYSIWLHGTKEKLKERSTNGCIAMNNSDIVLLDPYIKLWDTAIIVEERLSQRDVETSKREGRAFLEEIEGWRQAWSEKDLDRYLSYYSSAFRWQSLDLQGWRQRKDRLNRLYQAIQVQIGDIRIFRQGDLVLATFDEAYRSDLFASRGMKHLYLARNSEVWRILAEDWRKSEQPPPLVLAAKPAVPAARAAEAVSPVPQPPQPAAKLTEARGQVVKAVQPPPSVTEVAKPLPPAAIPAGVPAQAAIVPEPPPTTPPEEIVPPVAKAAEVPAAKPAEAVPPAVKPAEQQAPRITVASKSPEAAAPTTNLGPKIRREELAVQHFVEHWRQAWESGNIQEFMACYHRKFQGEGMNYRAWQRYKEEVFSRSGQKEIQLTDLQIELRRSRAVVTFKQRYQSATHEDLGLKTLQLLQRKGQWTILGETWQAL